jgi:hypothetical protein
MRIKISDLLSTSDWTVSSQPERDHLKRESDIVLSHPNFGKYHIEVKHVEAGEIFWSEREVSKAKDHEMKYWMVLMRPGYAVIDKNIIWLWDPLEELSNLPRYGKWIWRTEIDDLETEITGWNVPTLRKWEDATNFTFVINVSNEFLDSYGSDPARRLMCFKEKLHQVKSDRTDLS